MPLIVEDGSMPDGANSYASVAMADDYFSARGNTAWTGLSTEQKEAALVRGADFLNGLRWPGRKVAQRTMAWPRSDAQDGDGYSIAPNAVPEPVVRACCYLAGQYGSGSDPLAPRDRKLSSISVGAISLAWEGGQGDMNMAEKFPELASILGGLLSLPGLVRRLVPA